MKREELRRLAKAATPGPWRTEYLMGAGNDLLTAIIAGRANPDDLRVIGSTLSSADGQFVAAANPTRVLALLDERDALAARLAAAEAIADAARECLEDGRCAAYDALTVAMDAERYEGGR